MNTGAAGFPAEEKYQLLLQITQRVRDTLDLDEILNHLLDTVRTVVGYDAGGIFVLNRDLVPSAYQQPREMIAGIARRGYGEPAPETDRMLRFGEGVVGHVIRSGACVVVPDVQRDDHYVEARASTRSEAAVPILFNDRAIGALNLESDQLDAFSDHDCEMLRFFAEAASVAIEKAILHRRILENRRIDEQLEIARQVQERLLPAGPPVLPGYEIAGISIPTYQIGGDYFDYVTLPDGRLGVAIADVSGKGIPAALIMAVFRALLRNQACCDPDPAAVFRSINAVLPESTGDAAFVTAVYGVLDPGSGQFVYTNAGHNPPLLIRSEGSSEALTAGGTILGLFGSAEYESGVVSLFPGDTLVLYTDGVVEPMGATGPDFGIQKLAEAVRSSTDRSAAAVLHAITETSRAFPVDERHHDDFTLVVVTRTAVA